MNGLIPPWPRLQTMTTKATTHRFLFTLSLVELGKFKPVTLIPQDITVAVDVPVTADYIANFEEVTIKQLSGQNAPTLILSLKGLRYLLDQGQSN